MAVPISKPMSVKEIVAKSQDFEFNPNIQLKYWLRTADILLREAVIYEAENNDQQAYLLLMRYATLVAEYLSSHPDAKTPEGKKALKVALRNIPDVVTRLEILKPRLEASYQRWQARRESLASLEAAQDGYRSRSSMSLAETDPAIAGKSKTLAAAENGDLAVKLAHKEIRRRDAARRATRQAGITEEEEQERRTAGLWDDWETDLSKGNKAEAYDLQKRMEETRRRMDRPREDGAGSMASDGSRKRLSKPPTVPSRSTSQQATDYRYPSINKSQPFNYESQTSSSRVSNRDSLPPRPRKEALQEPSAPSVPSKQPLQSSYDSLTPQPPPYEPIESTPTPEDAPTDFTFRPSAYLENGSPLRTLFLPPTLRDSFLKIAASNTRANLETCGILCGTLISNALFVSRLVIPEQTSTSDTCETVNESALFDYCDSEDLMVLGWIHTHPSQTCFMSSRDLHTHCGYQVMMPEAIAIVCAPSKNPSWGVFRLTDPPGMKTVLNCHQTGLFHPHPEQDIYTDALRPGHVFEAKGLNFEVIDQRPGY